MENGIRERRRNEILKAASEEFSRCGFEATRIDAVAKRAGIGKSTVYEYFPSKEDLFLAAGQKLAGELLSNMREALGAAPTLREALNRYFRFVIELHQCAAVALPTLRGENSIFEQMQQLVTDFCREMRALICQILHAAAARDEIAPESDLDTAALVIISMSSPILSGSIRNEETNFDRLVDFIINALRNGKTSSIC